MRLLAASLTLLLLVGCAGHRYGFTNGPVRLHLTVPPIVDADTPFDISILIEGAMPQYETTVEILVNGEVVARGQGILPSRLLQLHGQIAREVYYERQYNPASPLEPLPYDAGVAVGDQPEPSVDLEIRLNYLDETGRLRVAVVRRSLRLTCRVCPI